MKYVYVISRNDGIFGDTIVGVAATRGVAMRTAAKMFAEDTGKEFANRTYPKYVINVRVDHGRAGCYTWDRTELFD